MSRAWFDLAEPQKFLTEEAGRAFHLSVRGGGKLLDFFHGIINVQTNRFFRHFFSIVDLSSCSEDEYDSDDSERDLRYGLFGIPAI